MKSRIFQFLLLSTFLLLCASIEVVAQDAGMSDVEVTVNTADNEKLVYTPGEEVRYVPRPSGIYAPTDSIALQMQDFPMQRAAQRPAERSDKQQAAKKDDSILTFNFLYYIIQKYKLQDIID